MCNFYIIPKWDIFQGFSVTFHVKWQICPLRSKDVSSWLNSHHFTSLKIDIVSGGPVRILCIAWFQQSTPTAFAIVVDRGTLTAFIYSVYLSSYLSLNWKRYHRHLLPFSSFDLLRWFTLRFIYENCKISYLFMF